MDDWEKFYAADDVLTAEEKAEIELKVDIIEQIVKAREESGLTQKGLQNLTKVQQACIARLERNRNDPQLTTMLKLLRPLGKTLAVVPINHKDENGEALPL